VILETSLSRQSFALVLTTENKETEQHVHLKLTKTKKLALAMTSINAQENKKL